MAKKPPVDPLEAAKVQRPPPAAPPAPSPPTGQLDLPPAGKPPEEARPVPPPGELPRPPAVRYRVRETTTVSLDGQLCVLHRDDVVSEASYGPRAMGHILASNVPLEELPA